MKYIEILGVIFGLISIYFTIKENIWCWPTGIIMVVLYLAVFFQARLYADVGLQAVNIVLQAYGWYEWLRGGDRNNGVEISFTSPRLMLLLLVTGAISTLLMGRLLAYYTDASIPYWDSTATVLSLIAQWMLARKLIENWLIWITVDVLSIGIYLYKELYYTTGLYAVFLILATLGYFQWKKSLKSLQPA